jgi:hypothetical protein
MGGNSRGVVGPFQGSEYAHRCQGVVQAGERTMVSGLCDGLIICVCVQNLDYNTPGGKLNRGMSVVDSAQILRGRPLDDNEYLKAAVLGWCVELVSPYYLLTFLVGLLMVM